MGFWDNLKGDTGAMRLAGIGQVLSALDQGQTPNVAPFLDAIGAQKQPDAFRQSLQGGDMMGKFSAEERSFLATLPPQLAQNLIAERLFAQSAPVNLQTFQGHDGTVYSFNPQTGQATPLTEAAPAPQGFRQITGQEAAALGLDPSKAYNVGPDGKISSIGDSGVTVNVGGAPGDGDLRKKLSEKEGEQWAGLLDAGMVSAGSQADFEMLGELMTLAPQGPVVGRLADAFPGVSSAGDAFNSIVKRVAPTLRAPGSGSTSDIEYDGMLRSLPSLKSSPEANQAILAMMQAKAQLNMERALIVDQYQNGEIEAVDARRALAELNRKSIMTPELKALLVGTGGGASADADLLGKYGLE